MTATYHIQWFGLLSERRGLNAETIQHAAGTARDLYQELAELHRLGVEVDHLRVAVNDRFVSWDHPLQDGDGIVFLPPMSGG